MKNIKLPLALLYASIVLVVIIATSVVVSSYNKNKPFSKDTDIESLSLEQLSKVQEKYSSKESKADFVKLVDTLHLAIANKLLDGSVTTEEELQEQISKINEMFKKNDWSYINAEYQDFFVGTWHLDTEGKIYFKFKSKSVEPKWILDDDVTSYIEKN